MVSYFKSFCTISVTLQDITVPSSVQNGSMPFVILDCRYLLNSTEKDGMVLKWSLNGKTVYQWIPPSRPQGLGKMRGKLNLDYEVRKDPFEKHRALYLHSPTTDLTGDYTCKVSTLQNEVSMTKKMTVYVPPRKVQIEYQKCSFDRVNITCMVDYAFPEPCITLYHGEKSKRTELRGAEERYARYDNGAWQKVVFLVLPHKLLQTSENTFECVASIPNTSIVTSRTTTYTPGKPLVMASATSGDSSMKSQIQAIYWVVIWAGLVWITN